MAIKKKIIGSEVKTEKLSRDENRKEERQKRQAIALRANLKKRKKQTRNCGKFE